MENPLNALKHELTEKTNVVAGLKIRMAEDSRRLNKLEESIKQYTKAIEALERVEIMKGG